MKINKKAAVITMLLCSLFSQVSYADIVQARIAYRTENYPAAFKYYLESAKESNLEAQYAVGVMYEKGIGTQVNYKEAAKWYSLAAERGKPEAQNNLGRLYYKGLGVPVDLDRAEVYFLNAERGGIKESYGNLGNVYRKKGGYSNLVEARKYYEMAASNGFIESQINLSAMYWNGAGGDKNLLLAYVWQCIAERLAAERNAQLPGERDTTRMESFLTGQQIEKAKQTASEWSIGEMIINN